MVPCGTPVLHFTTPDTVLEPQIGSIGEVVSYPDYQVRMYTIQFNSKLLYWHDCKKYNIAEA